MSQLKMIAILGIVLVISGVANGDAGHFVDHTGDGTLKYDRRGLTGGGAIIDVSKFPGAKADGASDMTQILLKAWNDACHATSPSTILIPAGIWYHGLLDFKGPCTQHVTINLQGTLKAKPDKASFPGTEHICIYQASVFVMGGGTIDGNGAELQAQRQKNDKNLADSMSFIWSPNSGIEGIKFLNAKGFNLKFVECDHFFANKLDIRAGGETLNTDGIHVARSIGATITDTLLAVGDDCISIGDATVNLTVRNIQCGPGHGISIGSLGKGFDEKDVRNIDVRNVTFTGTSNGVRIKTFHDSKNLNVANITFADMTMKDVYNPILIDQHYNGGNVPSYDGTSKVKISGVTYRNIKGNSMSNKAITLNCSAAAPCEGITLQDIQFTYTGNLSLDHSLSSYCENAKAVFTATTPPACPA